jgi:hypothetical protein
MTNCMVCGGPSTIRFCSWVCFVAYSKSRNGIECAICQWDHDAQRPGNAQTSHICDECENAEENRDWRKPSRIEQGTEDVDATVVIVGGGRLEGIHGGRRKFDTKMARRVVQIALRARVARRRRRRSAAGKVLRGWETVEQPPTVREIASMLGCSIGYVQKVLTRLDD